MPPNPNKPKTLKDEGYMESWSPFGNADTQDADPAARSHYFGKYQGTVVFNEDPMDQGRLILNVPDVHGLLPSNWALPCVPLADIASGTYIRPRIGSNVWVEFEGGDPQKPIWVGGFWGEYQTPLLAKAAKATPPVLPVITLETAASGMSICDFPIVGGPMPGNVILRAGTFASTIVMTPTGVTITAPSVTITTGKFTVAAANFTVI